MNVKSLAPILLINHCDSVVVDYFFSCVYVVNVATFIVNWDVHSKDEIFTFELLIRGNEDNVESDHVSEDRLKGHKLDGLKGDDFTVQY